MERKLNNAEIEQLFKDRLPDCFFQCNVLGINIETSLRQHTFFLSACNTMEWGYLGNIMAPKITNHEPITVYLNEDNHYYKATVIGNLVDYQYPWYHAILHSIFCDQYSIEYQIENLEEIYHWSQVTDADLFLIKH
jgi:hypothetical protein